MDHEHHAAEDIDKDETVPRIIAIIAGIVLIALVAGGLMYSGMWSPSNPTQISAPAAKH